MDHEAERNTVRKALHAADNGNHAGEQAVLKMAAALNEKPLQPVPATDTLYEIMSHLGAAVSQTIPSDDQIIANHVRQAHALATMLWRANRGH